MRRFPSTRALYFLLSLVIATVMWLYVATAESPVVERDMTIDLHVRGLGTDRVVVQAPSRVQIRLQGPRSALTLLTPALLDASVDLSGLRPGEHRVPVYVATPPEVRVVDRTPADALVVLDVLTRRRVPVQVDLAGTPPEGVTMGRPRVSPPSVVLSGAATQVEEVRLALVSLDMTNLRQQTAFSLPVHLVDATGQEVRGLTIEPSQVEATIPVRAGVITKVVPVVPTLVGVPLPPLAVTGAVVNPGTTTLSGPADLLGGVQAAQTVAVDIGRARGDVTRRVALQVPPGVSSSVRQVTVVIHIGHALLSTVFRAVPVKIVGQPAGTVARVVPDRVEVQVEGPQDLVRGLSAQAITVEVNATGRPPGEHRMALRAILPQGIHLLTIRPSQVVVILKSS